jgi:hypothetical protein
MQGGAWSASAGPVGRASPPVIRLGHPSSPLIGPKVGDTDGVVELLCWPNQWRAGTPAPLAEAKIPSRSALSRLPDEGQMGTVEHTGGAALDALRAQQLEPWRDESA